MEKNIKYRKGGKEHMLFHKVKDKMECITVELKLCAYKIYMKESMEVEFTEFDIPVRLSVTLRREYIVRHLVSIVHQ